MYSTRDDGRSAYAIFSRGMELLQGGHPHQAAMWLGRAKLLEPEKTSIREALGRALYMAGRHERARREFTKVVQMDPSNDFAHFALGLACTRTGQRRRAIGHLKLALAMCPGREEYRQALDRIDR